MINLMTQEILENRAFILVKGTDAARFLQGLLTKNIDKFASELNYCLMLTPQGKYLYELFLYKMEDEFILELYEGHKASFISKLKIYKLRSQVEIIDVSEDYEVIWSKEKIENVRLSLPDPRSNQLGYRSLAESSKLDLLNIPYTYSYKQRKYQLAIIDYNELIQEKSFPLEYGLDHLNAIDFDKGCYIGQEPISRTKYRGVVRKNIYKIEAEKNLEEVLIDVESTQNMLQEEDENSNSNYNLMAGDKKIGKILSYFKNNGIALIRDEELQKASEYNLPITVSGIEVNVKIPSWRLL
ncbi:MAG: gcvT [Rickettsiaceae bacterium]|nr:gcvT [Rickettsiaceae bacterium]